jgi:hypothetical protein
VDKTPLVQGCFVGANHFGLIDLKSLKLTKDKLDTIQSVQGLSLDELERQLGESKSILGKMHKNLQGDILSNLIEVAMACDEDGDFTLDDGEIAAIIHKLEGIHGVDVDNGKIKKMIVDSGRKIEGGEGPFRQRRS